MQSRPLLVNAFRPTFSPDGKRVAFFAPRPEVPLIDEDWLWHSDSHFALWVAEANGRHRRKLAEVVGFFPQVTWLRDGKNLLTTSVRRQGHTYLADITRWNVQTATPTTIGHVEARDFADFEYSQYDFAEPPIEALSLSHDGHSLFLRTYVFTADRGNYFDTTTSYLALNLKSGALTTIAQVFNVRGSDWREG